MELAKKAAGKKGAKKSSRKRKVSIGGRFNSELFWEIAGFFLIGMALFGIWALIPGRDLGFVGHKLSRFITLAFGAGSILFLIGLILVGLTMILGFSKPRFNRFIRDYLVLFLFFETFVHLAATFGQPRIEIIEPELLRSYGGWIGARIVFHQRALVANVGSLIFTSFLLAVLVMLRLGLTPSYFVGLAAERSARIGNKVKQNGARLIATTRSRIEAEAASRAQDRAAKQAVKLQEEEERLAQLPAAEPDPSPEPPPIFEPFGDELLPEPVPEPEPEPQLGIECDDLDMDPEIGPENPSREHEALKRLFADVLPDQMDEEQKADAEAALSANPDQRPYKLPSLELLKYPPPTEGHNESENQSRVLQKTLDDFAVPARIVHIERGPNVTRYELQLQPGVKVNRILNLHDEISMSLAAKKAVRIEAPIPGKSAIGIEVPNRDRATVTLRELLEAGEFQGASSLLTVALGKDISGTPIVADLAKMPHMLVAGATGSGKSVCINCIINSILYKATPDQVRFILIDPKRVELTPYEQLPHLLTSVVKEVKQAAGALKWAVEEMDQRYRLFAQKGFRNIEGHNAKMPPEEQMYRIVIIVDELADLMMTSSSSGNVEYLICRLAQLARATGIHLVIATQRPDVKVITGTIKANIPTRVAFAVTSQIDSRTILDSMGAEKLLGSGDMLFMPRGRKPIRIQGAFIDDDEILAVTEFIGRQRDIDFLEEVLQAADEDDDEAAADEDGDKDDLFDDAVRIMISSGQASISMLQRKLKIGYNRAARLVDLMEEKGIVGPPDGSNPREILVGEDFLAKLS